MLLYRWRQAHLLGLSGMSDQEAVRAWQIKSTELQLKLKIAEEKELALEKSHNECFNLSL